MNTVFAILKLPYLPIHDILSFLTPFEILNFSMVSKKSKILTKFLTRRIQSKFNVCLELQANPYIMIYGEEYANVKYQITSEPEKNGKREYEDLFGETTETFLFYSENPVEKWMKLFEHIKGVLNVNVIGVDFQMDLFENRRIIDWMEFQFQSCLGSTITGENVSHSDINYFLENLRVTESVFLESNSTETVSLKVPKNLLELKIQNGYWIRLHDFLNFDAKEIQIFSNSLTVQEIGSFLKSWMDLGSHLNTKIIQVQITDQFVLDSILQEVPHMARRLPDTMRSGCYTVTVHGGATITRVDGAEAMVCAFQEFDDWKLSVTFLRNLQG